MSVSGNKHRTKKEIIDEIFTELTQGNLNPFQLRKKMRLHYKVLEEYLDIIEQIQKLPKMYRIPAKKGQILTLSTTFLQESPKLDESPVKSIPKINSKSTPEPALLEQFIAELKSACKTFKPKIEPDRIRSAAQALLSKWQRLDLKQVDGTTYPDESEKILIPRLSDYPENFSEKLSEEEWEALRTGLQECWTQFYPLD
jgi:predicted transcriptional regulator